MSGKLFLGGISPTTTTEALEAHFMKYGNVIDAVVIYKDGKHRGFGFVTFDNDESVNAVLAEEQILDGRTVDVKPAVPQGEAPPPRGPMNGGLFAAPGAGGAGGPRAGPAGPAGGPPADKVFIGGLSQTTTEETVREYFSAFGNIIDCVVMKDRGSNRSRGFGFVQYDNTTSVDQVMAEYQTHQLDGKWVECKKAVPQDRMAPPPARGGPMGMGMGRPAIGMKGGGKGMWPAQYGGPAAMGGYAPQRTQYGMGGPSPYGPYGGYGSAYMPAYGAYGGGYVPGPAGRPW